MASELIAPPCSNGPCCLGEMVGHRRRLSDHVVKTSETQKRADSFHLHTSCLPPCLPASFPVESSVESSVES